jgi:plastocyanin
VPGTVLAVVALAIAGVNATSVSTTPTRRGNAGPTGLIQPPSARGTIVVIIRNFAFAPAHVTARPGERIKITNVDAIPHNFVATPDSNPQGVFNSGSINPNASASVAAPAEPGNYSFYCSFHPFMTGVLTVLG